MESTSFFSTKNTHIYIYIYEITNKVSFILLTVSFVSLTHTYGNLIHQTSPVLCENIGRTLCQNKTISNDERIICFVFIQIDRYMVKQY